MTVQILIGDVRDKLRELPDESVHCVVTSPPYFGLRDYGHEGQLGLEDTPAAYVEAMAGVFAEVRRVLRSDGTCWLNIGDSYCANRGNTAEKPGHDNKAVHSSLAIRKAKLGGDGLKEKDLIGIPWMLAFALRADGWWLRQDIIWAKPNPMPESVRDRCTKSHEYIFLLAKSERYFFDASAIAEETAYDGPPRRADSFMRKVKTGTPPGQPPQHREGREDISYSGTRNKRSVWTVTTQPFKEAHFATFPPALIEPCILAGCPQYTCGACGTAIDLMNGNDSAGTTGQAVATMQVVRPEGDTGPAEPRSQLLQQGVRVTLDGQESLDDKGTLHHVEGVCGDIHARAPERVEGRLCDGAPAGNGGNLGAAPVADRSGASQGRGAQEQRPGEPRDADQGGARQTAEGTNGHDPLPALHRANSALSTCPRCKANLEEVGIKPGVVLDCFGGAGTTGLVADRLQRNAILIELNPAYVEMAKRRIFNDSPMFAQVS